MYGLGRSGHWGGAPASKVVEGNGVTVDDAPLVKHINVQVRQCRMVPRAEAGTPMPVEQHCVELRVVSKDSPEKILTEVLNLRCSR